MKLIIKILPFLFSLVFLVCSNSLHAQPVGNSLNVKLNRQNITGQSANNFNFKLVDGKRQRLYSVYSKYIILFFYNPECDACRQYKQLLAGSYVINRQISNGSLKVLAIYIDKDLSVWKRHLPEMPKTWTHGADINEYLYKNNVYDLHAIPSIYLLDRYKKVILKDVLDVRLIEKELME